MKYKQKITTINYFENVVKISLTREEWNSSGTWVESMMRKGCERLSKSWFEDLHHLVMQPISNEINFSGNKYNNIDIRFNIPRELLRMFVYSIGQIAYDFDVKGITNIIAQNILEKINKQLKEQLSTDDIWFEHGF
jgi:urease gamma subunit